MITFTKAAGTPDGQDSLLLWQWRMDPLTRQMSLSTDLIPWESHQRWYAKAIADPQKVLLIAAVSGVPACMVRFDLLGTDAAEISINLNPVLRGQGQGKPVLAAACAYGFGPLKLGRIAAQIRSGNVRSIKIFEATGFICQGEHEGIRTYNLTA